MCAAPSPALYKLSGEPARLVERIQPSPEGTALLASSPNAAVGLTRLAEAGFLSEAARLAAHALPRREAVWWACMCARHTAPSGTDPPSEAAVRESAEEWVRRQTDELRRAAMARARSAGFSSPESWAAVAAFWSGDSIAPPEAPKTPPESHLAGLAVAGSVALSAVRGRAERRDARLRRFLDSARDIASGGAGHLEAEPS